ncbi:hypothetical protein GM50_8495 [freshwater metagenome]|uniref:Uncharacterized protein n=1 Tax=freshwater metagenome TaxID=449393 RepID=A0A094Q8Q4_9ZZZZ
MLSRSRILLVLISALAISTPSTSSFAADVTPIPTLSPAQQYELDLIKYKIEYRIYQDARDLREKELRAIAIEFNQALRRAAEDARNAGRGASSKAAFAAARALAAANRDKAVAELPPLMTPPQPPVKPYGFSAKGSKSKGPSPRVDKKN